ncbi:hypothetical protein TNCV_648041 [Trichonephila clavipes]|uniref:Uncharacterized protein n=1 Tax=Trichonephila clavipes TaxID=2585209 RepID=A0A8X6SMA8_TRICX|nr:hypothetical protein TNCV_648041 [Trichonephila clavipes]
MPHRDGPYVILTQKSPSSYEIASLDNPGVPVGVYYTSALTPCNIDKVKPLIPLRKRGRPPNREDVTNLEVWHLDLASMKSVKAFAEKYLSTKTTCHLLVNNAGIMFVKEEKTVDGYEKHFSVNYLGHCLLTQLLLPILVKSGTKENNSRIVNCTSCIHFVGSKDINSFQNQKYYSKYKAYIDSKLAQVMFTYSLQEYLKRKNLNVTVNCVHPGVVDTDLMTSVLLIPQLGSVFFKSAQEGAQTATYAALSPEMERIGGKYLEECTTVASSKISEDKMFQQELWEKTWKVLKPWTNDNGHCFMNTISLSIR